MAGDSSEPLISIGDLAALTGLSLRSIRYYEEVGLAVPVERSKGGRRRYDQAGL
jgi:DNA-binding transcriptional MerR regulator